jgi:hypothetical protein
MLLRTAWVFSIGLIVWCALAANVEAQRATARRRRAPRVIQLEQLDCDMQRWDEPLLVPLVAPVECASAELLVSCGLARPTDCPGIEDPVFLAALDGCAPSHGMLVSLVRAAEQAMLPASVPLIDRFAAGTEDDDVDRLLVAELARRVSLYDAARARFVALIDGAVDPAIRAFALERMVSILEYDDWNEDGLEDDDFASHFEAPRLPDRPWAREVAVRTLPRVGCLRPHAIALGTIRRRFGNDPEGVIEIDHATTLADEALRAHLATSVARCRTEQAPCVEPILDHTQNETRRALRACRELDARSHEGLVSRCREGVELGRWLLGERPLASLETDLAAASARLAWAEARPRGAPPEVVLTTPIVASRMWPIEGEFDRVLVRRRLSQISLARCPTLRAAVVVLVAVEPSGEVRAVSNSTGPCLRASLAGIERFDYGADGGTAWNTALFVPVGPSLSIPDSNVDDRAATVAP